MVNFAIYLQVLIDVRILVVLFFLDTLSLSWVVEFVIFAAFGLKIFFVQVFIRGIFVKVAFIYPVLKLLLLLFYLFKLTAI